MPMYPINNNTIKQLKALSFKWTSISLKVTLGQRNQKGMEGMGGKCPTS